MLMTDDELAGDIAVDFVEADWKSLSHVECRELNDKETLIIFHFCKPEHVREARILNQPEVQPYLKVDVDNMTLAWHIDAVFGINIINCLRRIDAVKVY